MMLRRVLRIALSLARLPLYAAYGAWAILSGAIATRRRLGAVARLLGETIQCPTCSTANAIHGRWRCRRCSAEYLGPVFECLVCSASATHFPCSGCGASIVIDRRALP